MNRRSVLVGGSMLTFILPGCTEVLDEFRNDGNDGGIPDDQGGLTDPPPQPELVDIDVDVDPFQILDREAQVYATVQNHGGPGDIIVEVEFMAQDGRTVIDRYQKRATIREGERRRYTIDVSPPRDAETFRVRVDTD